MVNGAIEPVLTEVNKLLQPYSKYASAPTRVPDPLQPEQQLAKNLSKLPALIDLRHNEVMRWAHLGVAKLQAKAGSGGAAAPPLPPSPRPTAAADDRSHMDHMAAV